MEKSQQRIKQLAEVMLHEMSDDDKKLCLQLLKSVEEKFTGLWQGHKGKEFGEIYGEMVVGIKSTKKE